MEIKLLRYKALYYCYRVTYSVVYIFPFLYIFELIQGDKYITYVGAPILFLAMIFLVIKQNISFYKNIGTVEVSEDGITICKEKIAIKDIEEIFFFYGGNQENSHGFNYIFTGTFRVDGTFNYIFIKLKDGQWKRLHFLLEDKEESIHLKSILNNYRILGIKYQFIRVFVINT